MKRWWASAVSWVGGHEVVVLIGILVPVVGIWAFLMVAEGVREGRTRGLDDRILLALRRPGDPATPIGPAWLAEAGRDVTALGSVTILVLVTAAVVGYLLLDRRYAAAAFVLTATATGFALSTLLKGAFRRPRPGVVPHLMPAHHSSFPSGHSMMSAVVYLTLGALLARLLRRRTLRFYVLAIAVAQTALVGVSRVFMGVHYPSDVLAGWCAGVVWASLCWLVERRLQRRGALDRA